MTFRIEALAAAPFRPLFELDDAALAARGAERRVADAPGAYPCRVSLADAAVGEELILVTWNHHAVASPYAASGPVFVRRAALGAEATCAPGEVPEQLQRRLLSVRGYDRDALMVAAEVVEGTELAALLSDLFAGPDVAYVHMHYARPGCYAARAVRA